MPKNAKKLKVYTYVGQSSRIKKSKSMMHIMSDSLRVRYPQVLPDLDPMCLECDSQIIPQVLQAVKHGAVNRIFPEFLHLFCNVWVSYDTLSGQTWSCQSNFVWISHPVLCCMCHYDLWAVIHWVIKHGAVNWHFSEFLNLCYVVCDTVICEPSLNDCQHWVVHGIFTEFLNLFCIVCGMGICQTWSNMI